MCAEIINLRQARKQKQRQKKEQTAADNRLKYGRSKEEREAARRRRAELEKQVDGHKLDAPVSPLIDPPDRS
ncbi:DUF4169 family protein [Roseibium denhamense]|uniref:DUF4169 family protein n=1 Tax=Roseibium denhamense TaxID=76305 RepID=A0ABY1NAB2_9HYPH|nr:DUF4169 family protein [Roseibium denhamense]MTI06536.1 DUF4169 family protein [Roseibium denhamense]SMP04753.1 protein of unknown function [Roseibium denhamense]